jgi:nicotinamide mononucleotide transporter
LDQIYDFVLGMTGSRPIEIAAVILGLINVTLIIRRNVWNYPFGIVMVILYAQIFYDYRLYSDALLQIYFLVIQIYGWWYWLRGRDDRGLVIVARLPIAQIPYYAVIAIVGLAILGTSMDQLTDADYPYWDGAIAVLSVLAQFLLSRRRLESWFLWIAVDLLAIGLFWVKGLYPTSALYAVFLVLATVGLFNWVRAWRRGVALA